MSRVAILTDSSSGITQAQAKELGISVLPMPFFINGQTYYEDIDLTQEVFYQKLGEDVDISTSMPAMGDVKDRWEELLQEYDEVVYIPLSSGLSSSCETAMVMAQEYEGKVQVVNNQSISVTMKHAAIDAKRLADAGKSAVWIKEILEKHKMDASIYIMVDTLYYLKKGGRITPAAAALGTLLKLKPVLQIQGDKLDAFAKARTGKQAKSIMLQAMADDFEKRFGDADGKKIRLMVAHTNNASAAEEFAAEIKERFPGHDDMLIDPLSLNVACHIGPGALAIACSCELEEI